MRKINILINILNMKNQKINKLNLKNNCNYQPKQFYQKKKKMLN